mgnify:FL=1
MKIYSNIKYIFVDYFDTTCFRHIHSSQIYLQWAKVLKTKFPILASLSDEKLVEMRHKAHHMNGEHFYEKPYHQTMEDLYSLLSDQVKLAESCSSFVESSLNIDVSVEIGCQYGNQKIISMLRKEKAKGKQIFLVSDFYLPMEAYHDFLVNLQCEDLFDKVYVSESFNKTKAHGDLYDYILKENSIKADEVVMIGDSTHSDMKMAREHGLHSIWYFPLRHKLWTNFSRLTKRDFSNSQLKKRFHELFHHSTFAEYAIPLYYFSGKLSEEMKPNMGGQVELNFLARGGFFMKKAYDAYQKLVMPLSEIIKTHYFLNSRKVVFLAKDAYKKMDGSDETDFTLQKDYLLAHSDHGKFYMVDEGWYNHSQQMLTEMLNIETFGYYIGSCRKEKLQYDDRCHRKGLLFEMRDDNKILSPFFGIFCTNRSMYEQLLSAPHGSVRKYKSLKDGEVQVEEKYEDKEKYIYDTYTRKLQDLMLVNVKGLTAWNIDNHISLRLLSRLLLKSALFNSRKRCRFLNDLDRNMVDNCGGNQSFQVKGIKDVRINVVELLLHPANYLGMLAKVQRKIVDKSYLMPPYYILASFAYFYIRFLNLFENEDK